MLCCSNNLQFILEFYIHNYLPFVQNCSLKILLNDTVQVILILIFKKLLHETKYKYSLISNSLSAVHNQVQCTTFALKIVHYNCRSIAECLIRSQLGASSPHLSWTFSRRPVLFRTSFINRKYLQFNFISGCENLVRLSCVPCLVQLSYSFELIVAGFACSLHDVISPETITKFTLYFIRLAYLLVSVPFFLQQYTLNQVSH